MGNQQSGVRNPGQPRRRRVRRLLPPEAEGPAYNTLGQHQETGEGSNNTVATNSVVFITAAIRLGYREFSNFNDEQFAMIQAEAISMQREDDDGYFSQRDENGAPIVGLIIPPEEACDIATALQAQLSGDTNAVLPGQVENQYYVSLNSNGVSGEADVTFENGGSSGSAMMEAEADPSSNQQAIPPFATLTGLFAPPQLPAESQLGLPTANGEQSAPLEEEPPMNNRVSPSSLG